MGAATSLMFGVNDPSVACMVLDSPFSSLKVLANELVSKNEMKIPKMVVNMAFKVIKKSIEKKANFDIEKLEPIKSAAKCFIPALFAHGNDDDFIDVSHSRTLSGKYAGDYNLITFDGDHQSQRPSFFYDSVCIFFENNLNVSSDFGDDNLYVEEELDPQEMADIADGPSRGFKSKKRYIENDEFERARQLSLQEAYSAVPKSAEEEDELLQLALKMSLMESEDKPKSSVESKDTKDANDATDSKDANSKDAKPSKDAKDSKSKENKPRKDSSTKTSKKIQPEDDKMVGLDADVNISDDHDVTTTSSNTKGGKKSSSSTTTKKKK